MRRANLFTGILKTKFQVSFSSGLIIIIFFICMITMLWISNRLNSREIFKWDNSGPSSCFNKKNSINLEQGVIMSVVHEFLNLINSISIHLIYLSISIELFLICLYKLNLLQIAQSWTYYYYYRIYNVVLNWHSVINYNSSQYWDVCEGEVRVMWGWCEGWLIIINDIC